MKKMKKYYFETHMGCGIREYPDGMAASKGILAEVGTAGGLKFVKEATQEEIEWVKSMGGRVE